MSIQNYKRQLLAPGIIIQKLHYGPFAVGWWVFIKTKPTQNKQTCIPIRVNMRIKFELNQKEFIIRVVDNNWKLGYVCELDTEAIIYLTSSATINETYKKIFNAKTRFSEPSVLALGSSDQVEWNFAGSGYRLSFFHKYRGQHSLIHQSIMNMECRIDIYHQEIKIQTYTGKSPSDVWTKPNILKSFDGKDLFGLSCDWNNIEIMTQAFEKYLKRRISVVNLNWHLFFTKWKQQSTTIIEFSSHLASIYPADFEFTNTILGAWKSMMRYVGCTDITPYKKKESNLEFWMCAEDPSSDRASILYLYTKNLLNNIPYNPSEAEISVRNQDLQNKVDQFWNCFNTSIKMNKRGLDGKQRILSVIANDFGRH
ncbi:hypothetical protein Glove_219g105 [Diversispora epigaea]|uniref:Uncharacterized protein n=1 Tax=Diversispora epigaea TaxID=1348612 RepID=A0A397IG80_9GLOM|nr:hypothetical protein Glove_219g105 [Diversispora epigaea]